MASETWLDYYAILELYDPINQTGSGPGSTPVAIKQAWKLQLSAWHPDKFRGDTRQKAEERTKLINSAYEVLSDPKAKQAYDVAWMRKNPWFGQEREAKSSVLPEISVRWDPPDALSNVFYNIPPGEKRQATLIVEPRVGRGFWVEIEEPASGWIRVVEPKDRRGIPPFTAVIEVDTAPLLPEQLYSDELLFMIEEG